MHIFQIKKGNGQDFVPVTLSDFNLFDNNFSGCLPASGLQAIIISTATHLAGIPNPLPFVLVKFNGLDKLALCIGKA